MFNNSDCSSIWIVYYQSGMDGAQQLNQTTINTVPLCLKECHNKLSCVAVDFETDRLTCWPHINKAITRSSKSDSIMYEKTNLTLSGLCSSDCSNTCSL